MDTHAPVIPFRRAAAALGLAAGAAAGAEAPPLRVVRESAAPDAVVLRVRAADRSPHPVPKTLTGKFAEHLGWNIYNGMDAQILRNPVFAEVAFWTGRASPDGTAVFHAEEEKIAQEIRRQAPRFGWPEAEIDGLVRSRADGLAGGWARAGARNDAAVSPDTGPHGGRAQRVEARAAGAGIAQWTWLPLHRVRDYEFEILARSPEPAALTVSLAAAGADRPAATAAVPGLGREWKTFRGRLALDAGAPAGAAYRFAVTADAAGQFVIARALLRPADHVNGADPDVVRLLKESRLPVLRWPGGNFVSGYHWEDGVGPPERRPARPNPAWGGVETNLFGTAEFVAFCRAVGCEPMICVNGGDGTPEEAARWIAYCNGPVDSPGGRLRAAHGHPEPFGVRHWEAGNELWGRWQVRWTTPAGYVDRFREFARAMRAADPSITLYACGAPVMWGKDWNDALVRGAADLLGATTDHPLVGGSVTAATDPLDVYRDFMAVPEVLERKWAALESQMREAGVREPRLAVTELQMFARLGGGAEGAKLTRETLVSPATLAEALYDVLIYHACVRLGPFVPMVTHSATVNHGGGLRKERERVWANPCHYAQSAFADFAGAVPVGVDLETPMASSPRVLPDLRSAAKEPVAYGAVDALAAVAPDGSLLLSIVHRGTAGPLRLAVDLGDFAAAKEAEARTLAAEVPWAANTLEAPEAVRPADAVLPVDGRRLAVDLKPYSVLRVRVRPAR
jgi:alpha-N-arabinofuranosidase